MSRCRGESTSRRSLSTVLALTILAAGCAAGAETERAPTESTAAAPATTVAVAPATPAAAVPSTTTSTPMTALPPPPTTAVELPATTAAPQPTAPASPPAEVAAEVAAVPADDAETAEPAPASELTERVVAALADRSFRQFNPGRDADRRKAVILDFFAGTGLWAQYAEGEHALVEWEIRADSYRVEGRPDGSEVTLYFVDPRGSQILPTTCATCVAAKRVSISVMNVFDPERIVFKVNDPYGELQSPFPVFDNWTRFEEDELFH